VSRPTLPEVNSVMQAQAIRLLSAFAAR